MEGGGAVGQPGTSHFLPCGGEAFLAEGCGVKGGLTVQRGTAFEEPEEPKELRAERGRQVQQKAVGSAATSAQTRRRQWRRSSRRPARIRFLDAQGGERGLTLRPARLDDCGFENVMLATVQNFKNVGKRERQETNMENL